MLDTEDIEGGFLRDKETWNTHAREPAQWWYKNTQKLKLKKKK